MEMSSRGSENYHPTSVQLFPECLAITFVADSDNGSAGRKASFSRASFHQESPAPHSPGGILKMPTPSPNASPKRAPSSANTTSSDLTTTDLNYEQSGCLIYQSFARENQKCHWNPCLVNAMSGLEFVADIRPWGASSKDRTSILITGSPYNLEVTRSAWARRVLRPPLGYAIEYLGNVNPVLMNIIPQTQFAPLAEALCKTVQELNSEKRKASLDVIAQCLKKSFPKMTVPSNEILYRTLGALIKERKIYHTGKGYFLVSPTTYRSKSPMGNGRSERQMLMTNEEAIDRLYRKSYSSLHEGDDSVSQCIQTDAREIQDTLKFDATHKVLYPSHRASSLESFKSNQQLERRHSMKVLSHKEKDKLNRRSSFRLASLTGLTDTVTSVSDSDKEEVVKRKRSVFSRLFRRSQSCESKRHSKNQSKRSTFSAQFPPPEWSDSSSIQLHSQGTQTLSVDAYLPKVRIRSRSVGRSNSQDRHSIHSIQPNHYPNRAIERYSCYDSDVSLRTKSMSLPRHRSYHAPPNADTEPPRRCSTPNAKRSSKIQGSPQRTPCSDRRRARVLPPPPVDNKLNNGSRVPPDVDAGSPAHRVNGVGGNARDIRFNNNNNHNHDASEAETHLNQRNCKPNSWTPQPPPETETVEKNEVWNNSPSRIKKNFDGETTTKLKSSSPVCLPKNNKQNSWNSPSINKTTVPLKESNTLKQSNEFINQETPVVKKWIDENEDDVLLKGERKSDASLLNESIDLEVNLKTSSSTNSPTKGLSSSPDCMASPTTRSTSRNHTISIKTGSSRNKPVTITAITSIRTSVSQDAIKTSDEKKQSLLNGKNKIKSADSIPIYANLKSPLKTNNSDVSKNHSNNYDADDSGFITVSPV